jgi:carotenoid cleavage dioxygenase-like enzyme
MNRREFLMASLAASAGHWLAATVAQPALTAAAPDWTLGWRGTKDDAFAPMSMQIDGDIPAACHGSLYRNGPARIERDGVRCRHWFDGDGLVQHFRIGRTGVTHDARFVQTEKYEEEQAAGRFLYGGAGTSLPDGLPARNNDTRNVANTALLPWDDELLALWEGGSAYRLDRSDLATLGRKDWRDDLQHMPFSAHPLREADGTLWNFGSAPYAGKNGMLFIYGIEPRMGVKVVQSVPLPMASYMHSFAMTEHYLLFYLAPHCYNRGAASFVESFEWKPEQGGRVLLVNKNDLSQQRWFEAPAGFVFHFAHAFERQGEIVARMALYPTAEVMSQGMFELMQASNVDSYPDYPRARLVSLRLDTRSGKTRMEDAETLIEFPGIDARFALAPTPVFGVGHAADSTATYSNAVVSVDTESGRVDRYAFPKYHVVEEPLFVAEPGSREAGWLVGTFLDYSSERTGVYVLDAGNLDAGPVAVATMDRHMPLGFHGCFVGET